MSVDQDGAWETTRQLIEWVRGGKAAWTDYQSAEHVCEAFDVDPAQIATRGYLILTEAVQGGDVDARMDAWAEDLRDGIAA